MTEPEYSARGRWKGRLTRRALPREDALMNSLTADERSRLAAIWQHRAAMERRVADSFEQIEAALLRRRAGASLVALAHRAIDDEYRHAELSRLVASRFAGYELPTPPRLTLEVPEHRGATPELRDSLFIVGQCVLNETTAGAFLEVCLSQARGPLAVAALRELLSDEIDHGRIGWAYLASLDERTRAGLSTWLLPMAFLNLREWRRESPDDPDHSPALAWHGAPAASVIHGALVNALESLIVPGLVELGMATTALENWLLEGAPTDRAPTELMTEPVWRG